jgi:hypothetical protein
MKRYYIYSKQCQSCANLTVILNNMNMLSNFEMICIEDLIKNNKQIPPNIKTVPALILQDLNLLLQGKETFEWIEKIKNNMMKMNIAKNTQNNGPQGFTDIEMRGISDKFAYTDTDFAQPKSFLPYGKDDDYAIFTGVEVNKISNKDMNKLLTQTNQKRKEQDINTNKILDESKKELILNYKKQELLSDYN